MYNLKGFQGLCEFLGIIKVEKAQLTLLEEVLIK